MLKRALRLIIILTTMSLLFGGSFVATKIALKDMTPFEILFFRFVISSFVFFIFSHYFPVGKITIKDFIILFLMVLLEPGLYFVLETFGVKYTTASASAVLIATIPLMVLALGWIFLGERGRPFEVFLIILSFAGIIILVKGGNNPTSESPKPLFGNILILGAALCASTYTIITRHYLKRYTPSTVSRMQTLLGSAIFFPLAFFDMKNHGFPEMTAKGFIALLYLGIGCSFLAYYLLNLALSLVEARYVASFTNIIPICAISLGVLLLDEKLTLIQVPAIMLVLGSVYLISLRLSK